MDQRPPDDPARQTPLPGHRISRLPRRHQPETSPNRRPNTTPPTPEFKETQTPETFSGMPSVHIRGTQENPENTETPNYNSDNIPAISGEVTTAEPGMDEKMDEADNMTERA